MKFFLVLLLFFATAAVSKKENPAISYKSSSNNTGNQKAVLLPASNFKFSLCRFNRLKGGEKKALALMQFPVSGIILTLKKLCWLYPACLNRITGTHIHDEVFNRLDGSLDFSYVTKNAFMTRYKNGVFIGRNGYWSRSAISGYGMVFMPFYQEATLRKIRILLKA